MAQQVKIVLIDDVDGSTATQTVNFGLDGTQYEIDLNDDHASELRASLESWISSSRKVAGSRRGRKAAPAAGGNAAAIREWARSKGYEVSDRGRVSVEIREAYAKAH